MTDHPHAQLTALIGEHEHLAHELRKIRNALIAQSVADGTTVTAAAIHAGLNRQHVHELLRGTGRDDR
jgi:hypothetical protein